jgi:hypothetical protein
MYGVLKEAREEDAIVSLQRKIREKVGTNELLPICSRPLFWTILAEVGKKLG